MHKLPNDPLFQKLNPLQFSWIIENMAADAREQVQAMKGANVQTQAFESSDDAVDRARRQRKVNG